MILDEIVALRRRDVERDRRDLPLARLEEMPLYAEPRRAFAARLRRSDPAVIAEVKKASPSRGVIRADFEPVAIARLYESAGASAVSVLTEERFFQGALEHLRAVRAAVGVPLLRKDFLFDPYQVVEARAWGADAVLLIAAVLDGASLRDMLQVVGKVGLEALVEVHTREELEGALAAGALVIGINNRDLRTFVTTLATSEQLRPLIPASALAVAESGIETAQDVTRLRSVGFSVFLIGETLMRASDPGAKLRELMGGA